MNNQNPDIPVEDSQEASSGRQLLLQEIGSKLNQARQEKGEQISKAVRYLKIPINHMQALESGNWDALPDDVYVIGFLRQYSNYLGLDLSDEINRLKNSDYTLTRPLTFPDPPVAPSRRWAWMTGTAFVILFVAFNIINNDAETQQPMLLDNTEQVQIETTANAEHSNRFDNEQVKKPTQKPQTADITTTTPPAIEASLAQAKPHSTAPASTTATPAQPQPSKAHMHSFRFEAVTSPVWLQLFAPNKSGNGKGRLIKELLLKQGQFATVRRATESLWITCGNALALRIRVDKKVVIATGKLGSGKKVLRDYRFNINEH